MFVVDSCCCCIPLRVGCLIIGYINLIGSLILTILAVMGVSAAVGMAYAGADENGAVYVLLAVSGVILVVMIIFLVFNIVLLAGLHQNKARYVKVYMIYSLVFIIIYTILFIAGMAVGLTDAVSIIEKVLEILLSIYFLIVIRSHYVNMLGTNQIKFTA